MLIELLKYVCNSLEENKIEYMLSGSIALSLYAVPRFTRDIDIVLNLKKEDIEKFIALFENNFYLNSKTIKHEVDKKGMFNIIDNNSGYKIDFIIKKETEFRNAEFARKQFKKVFDFNAWVVSAEDLIISKIIWIQTYVSDTQMNDIRSLLRNDSIDKVYITDWCNKLRISTFNQL